MNSSIIHKIEKKPRARPHFYGWSAIITTKKNWGWVSSLAYYLICTWKKFLEDSILPVSVLKSLQNKLCTRKIEINGMWGEMNIYTSMECYKNTVFSLARFVKKETLFVGLIERVCSGWIKKRIFIPCHIFVQKLYSPFQSVVSKQTLDP